MRRPPGRARAALGIRGRLTAAYVAVLVALLVILGAYLFAGARQTLESAERDRVEAAAAVLAAGLGSGAIDASALDDATRLIDPGLAAAVLREGRIVARAGWPVRFASDRDWPRPGPADGGSGFLELSTGRLAWAGRSLGDRGSVVVVADATGISATLAEIAGVLILILVGAALAGALLIWWVTGRALAPVRRLAEASGRVAAGDPSARVPPEPGSDELARVGEAFNAMAARVEETLDRQRQFVTDASHELRTPLTGLIGSLDVLERAGAADARRLRASMTRQLHRLARIVDDLMILARTDAVGSAALELRVIDLALIARDVVDEARALPEAARREIRLRAPASVPVHGDPDALHRVLLNLVVNGLRHGASPIEVTVDADAGGARCRIRDAGAGVPADLIPLLFERFRRGPVGEREGEHGSGLGLAIAKAIVDAHGGTLALHNDGGAVVTLTLPAR